MTYMALSNAYQQMLEYGPARQVLETMIQQARSAGDLTSEVFGSSLLGRMILQEGELHATYQIVFQALQQMENQKAFSPFSATLFGELAQVYYHWHQLDEARDYFARSVQWSTLGGFSDAEIYHSVFLSRLFQMEGDLQSSVHESEKAVSLDVKELSAYQAVIVGSPIRNSQWLPEALRFVQDHQRELSRKRVALFTLSITLAMSNREQYRRAVSEWTAPVRSQVRPVSEGLFARRLDFTKLPLNLDTLKLRLVVALGIFPKDDRRDWNAVRAWAKGLSSLLLQ